MSARKVPNILIAGTPGTGKSTLVKELMADSEVSTKMMHIDVGEYAKQNHLIEEDDVELNSQVLDEDALIDHLEANVEAIKTGGVIFDYHAGDLIPDEWLDRIYVLRAETNHLYDRLKERGYNEKKLTNNVDAEIFQVILIEAQEMCPEIVHQLQSNTDEDLKANSQEISKFIVSWLDKKGVRE